MEVHPVYLNGPIIQSRGHREYIENNDLDKILIELQETAR
jgi:hypothetical protein